MIVDRMKKSVITLKEGRIISYKKKGTYAEWDFLEC
jgi:hypothetical protein